MKAEYLNWYSAFFFAPKIRGCNASEQTVAFSLTVC